MESYDAVLIGYDRQENLGLGYITSTLLKAGYKVLRVGFDPSRQKEIARAISTIKAKIIGFSVIFQYSLEEFHELARELRARGVNCYFCAGGHFPSLRPRETFRLIPELDIIVRFEGEATMLELMEKIDARNEWSSILGLAYRNSKEIEFTPNRPLIRELDTLPPPYRDRHMSMRDGTRVCFLMASRGCTWSCTFCSVRTFYRQCAGRARRIRSPASVVSEIYHLYVDEGVRVFSFQDDDFAAGTDSQTTWLSEFLDELHSFKLADKIAWKISCRVDDLEEGKLDKMIDGGLAAVYLGIESGNEQSLALLGKHVSVNDNYRAIDLVKRRQVLLSMGFMLFDPSSTFQTIKDNIGFLAQVGRDGYFPLNFCKMLPYAGTEIENRLLSEGRLTGTALQPGYQLVPPALDRYECIVHRVFARRNFSNEGLVVRLQDINFDLGMREKLSHGRINEPTQQKVTDIIGRANRKMVDTLSALLEWAAGSVEGASAKKMSEDEVQTIATIAAEQWKTDQDLELELDLLLTDHLPFS